MTMPWRHPRKTEVWTMVFVQARPGYMVPMWQTVKRTRKGEQVITIHPDDVPKLLLVRSQDPIKKRVKVIFQPWED
jgi:hypothetical protein